MLPCADRAPTLASGANIAAFNVGNALGAWIGGLTIAAGLGFTSPLWAGAAMTAVGLVVLLVAVRARGGEWSRAVRPPHDTAPAPAPEAPAAV